jgi:hypothetical protein
LYDGFIVKRRHDTEVVAATAQSPVQIRKELRGCIDDNARSGDDFEGRNIITSKSVLVCEVADPSTKSKPTNTDVRCLRYVSAYPAKDFGVRAG